MAAFLHTIIHRPYVFIFLAAFLILGRLYFGWGRTWLWLAIGYGIAWLSEFSSIHTGFPYGWYAYRYENMPGELMVAGVPFWDSLSYPFLIFAGYTTAQFIGGSKAHSALIIALFGAFLTMLLDLIIDPLANLGEKWFLGDIYDYPEKGFYFGVPLSNFLGWFLVAFLVIVLFQKIDSILFHSSLPATRHERRVTLLHPLFYIAIALFNIAVTLAIQEWALAAASLGLLLVISGILYRWRLRTLKAETP